MYKWPPTTHLASFGAVLVIPLLPSRRVHPVGAIMAIVVIIVVVDVVVVAVVVVVVVVVVEVNVGLMSWR